MTIFGVEYALAETEDGGDLYLTKFGLLFWRQLRPENWYEPQWFADRRIRLEGSSTIYRLPTKPVAGVSLDLVVRFSRVGQEVPLPASILNEHPQAEFNDPFEEFALVMQLRNCVCGGPGRQFTKKPLAIYVPSKNLQEWQTGRSSSKMAVKEATHPEVPLHVCRDYILLYGWIKGVNAVQAARALRMSDSATEVFLKDATLMATRDLQRRGFRVLDMKPEHVVLRVYQDGSLLRGRDGHPVYALVDYELLERIDSRTQDATTLCAS
jgi:hypothetical protein